MFNVSAIKNQNKSRDKRKSPPDDVLNVTQPGRVMPYFSVVPEQVALNPEYNALCRNDQGDFWRMIMLMWRDGGALLDHPKNANDLGMTDKEFSSFRQRLIDSGLLCMSISQHYLVQKELRQQYMMTLEVSINRARHNSTRGISANADHNCDPQHSSNSNSNSSFECKEVSEEFDEEYLGVDSSADEETEKYPF